MCCDRTRRDSNASTSLNHFLIAATDHHSAADTTRHSDLMPDVCFLVCWARVCRSCRSFTAVGQERKRSKLRTGHARSHPHSRITHGGHSSGSCMRLLVVPWNRMPVPSSLCRHVVSLSPLNHDSLHTQDSSSFSLRSPAVCE